MQQVRVVGAATRAPSAQAPEAEPARDPEEAMKARAEELKRAEVASLEARMTGEGFDPTWARDTERQIERVVAGVAGTKFEKAECASTLYRVVVRHETRDDQRALAEIRRQEPFQQGIYFGYDCDALTTTMFVLRAGHSFREDG